MRFNVAAMITAIDNQIAADLTHWQERRQKLDDDRVGEQMEWFDQYGDAWAQALKKASAKLRRGQPLVSEDFPTNTNRYLAVYRSQVRDLAPFKADPDLLSLQVVLRTVADEEVTSAGLKELGVTGATMRRAVQAMAPSSVRSR